MDKNPKSAQLNLVPFIDIMLVLLCIVLSISSFIATGKVDIDLPEYKEAPKNDAQKIINLEVDKNNFFYFDGELVEKAVLVSKIQELSADRHLSLRIDQQADFKAFIEIIELLKEKRHENFSIATER